MELEGDEMELELGPGNGIGVGYGCEILEGIEDCRLGIG